MNFFTNLHDGEKKISIASSVATFPRPTCPNKMQNCQTVGIRSQRVKRCFLNANVI